MTSSSKQSAMASSQSSQHDSGTSMTSSLSVHFSLFESLAPSQNSPYPATGLINYLLRIVAHDACLAKRNNHLLYSTVADVKETYNQIDRWIDQVDKDDNWNDFIRYTQAINPLEELSVTDARALY
jgi:hypothetical protein